MNKQQLAAKIWESANQMRSKIENNKAICLDYSVAKGGLLVAFKSESLSKENLEEGFVTNLDE